MEENGYVIVVRNLLKELRNKLGINRMELLFKETGSNLWKKLGRYKKRTGKEHTEETGNEMRMYYERTGIRNKGLKTTLNMNKTQKKNQISNRWKRMRLSKIWSFLVIF